MCNVTPSFLKGAVQDPRGVCFNFEDCVHEVRYTAVYYYDCYSIKMPLSIFIILILKVNLFERVYLNILQRENCLILLS